MGNSQALKSQMSERFINKHEVQENILKIQERTYRNDIDDYLVQMNLLNTRLAGSCPIYHNMIRAGLPTKFKTHMGYGEEEPDHTTEFMNFVRRMRKRHEEPQRLTKSERRDPPKDTKDSTSVTRPPKQSRFTKTSNTSTGTNS